MNLDNFKYYQAQKWYGDLASIKPVEVSQPTRESFYRAFGIEVEEQIQLEREFDSWTYNFTPDFQAPEWISYPHYLKFVGCYTPPGNDHECVTCHHAPEAKTGCGEEAETAEAQEAQSEAVPKEQESGDE